MIKNLIYGLAFILVPFIFSACGEGRSQIKPEDESSVLEQDLLGDTLRLDTHIHLYDTRREGSVKFINANDHPSIYFPHFPKTFSDTADPAGVHYAVIVEASKRREDNYWLMNLVDTADNMLAFIANLDPRDPFYLTDLDSLSTSTKFRGIRIRPEKALSLNSEVALTAFGELEKRGLVLELGGDYQPDLITTIAKMYPDLPIIINHLAGGRMINGEAGPADWTHRVQVFASEPNVYCKVSALFTLSGKNPAPTDFEFYTDLIDPVVEAFGPDRVIYGSNWTLSDLRGRYTDLITLMDDYLESRQDLSYEDFYYNNAIRIYGLKE